MRCDWKEPLASFKDPPLSLNLFVQIDGNGFRRAGGDEERCSPHFHSWPFMLWRAHEWMARTFVVGVSGEDWRLALVIVLESMHLCV